VVAGNTWGAWRTLRSEHLVTVETGGERRILRGVIAVERPGRFRLRALGPGGVTLFDLLYRDGATDVIHSLRDPRGETFARILASIASDLAAAYDLAPRAPGRTVRLDGADVLVEEPGRKVRLGDFREAPGAKGAAPSRIVIEHPDASPEASYRVTIRAEGTALDEPLDPALFAK
jgi:hypothetical protein